jgi:hypothetical protein
MRLHQETEMKTRTLKIGGKGVTAVTVPLQQPENVEELTTAAKGNVEVIMRWANRGRAIEHQERSGARDKLKELRAITPALTDDEITKQVGALVAGYDPTVAAARGGPRERKPVTIVAPKGGKLTMDDFRKQLEAAGVKINFAEAGGDAPVAK